MESISTYSEARNEYLKQLSTWIVPFMVQHYRTLWFEAQKIGGQQREMVVFQEKCAEVPKWNQDIINLNVGKLLDNCKCDYLEELMAAVFIAHTKVLIAIRVSSRHKKLQITLPKLDNFMHRIFSECARSFWKTPFLFLDDQKPIEMQKNLLQAEALCSDAIASAVRSMLPIKNILNEYLSDDVMSAEPVIEEPDEIKPIVGGASEEKKADQEPKPEPKIVSEVKTEVEPEKPEVQEPEVALPEVALPEAALPEVVESIPELVVSELEMPNKALVPELEMPMPHVEAPEPEEIIIETEPTVRFSDYDNVFDESKEQVGTFAYKPKDEDVTPQLQIIEDSGTPLSADESVTNLESSGGLMEADEILE